MEITTIQPVNGRDLSIQDLISYLSQVVLTQIDEKIERKRGTLDQIKELISETKVELKTLKERLVHVRAERKRLDALYGVLKLIDSLKQEGVLIGTNRTKISSLLYKVQDLDISNQHSIHYCYD